MINYLLIESVFGIISVMLEILQHQQSSSSNLERRLQRDSPVPKDDDGGSRGSGIEEI